MLEWLRKRLGRRRLRCRPSLWIHPPMTGWMYCETHDYWTESLTELQSHMIQTLIESEAR